MNELSIEHVEERYREMQAHVLAPELSPETVQRVSWYLRRAEKNLADARRRRSPFKRQVDLHFVMSYLIQAEAALEGNDARTY